MGKKPRIGVKNAWGRKRVILRSDNLKPPAMTAGQQRSLIAILKGFNLKRLP